MWKTGKFNYGAVMFDVVLAINVIKQFHACKDSFTFDAEGDEKIDQTKSTCGESILGAIAMYDPTGLTGIAKAFMKPKCDHS